MTYRAVLRGYLLEEALAWLLRNSGYRLLVDPSQDTDELVMHRGALCVKGRGAIHQADVLGEFAFTPAFSLPIRLFLEAKYYRKPCELPIVRNAHGVIHDVNENFVHHVGSRPRRRYQYAYALFSANGFTEPAQDYALAQQISVIDLSGESFAWLRNAISVAAADLYTRRNQYHVRRFPVSWMRQELRARLGTRLSPAVQMMTEDVAQRARTTSAAPMFRAAALEIITAFAGTLRARERAELLLGFPAAPFVLPLGSDDPAGFLAYAAQAPSHSVQLRRRGSAADAEWEVSPSDDSHAYLLTFNLPDHVESWISGNEDRRAGTSTVKTELLSYITVYRREGESTQVCQLRYEPGVLRRVTS
jgi:hypothetical protein